MIRLPIEPLERWFAVRHPPETEGGAAQETRYQLSAARRMADVFGVSLYTIPRWRVYGLTITAADRAAITVGFHPVTFWPEWFDLPPEGPVCGTRGGYQLHRRRGEPTCDECRAAEAERCRLRKAEARLPKPEYHPLIVAVMEAEDDPTRKNTAA